MANAHQKPTPKKPKLVRDSFTIPKAEFVLIEDMKSRAIALGTSVKKSELLRAGLKLLQGLNDPAYVAALAAVPTLKTGRPGSEATAAEPVQAVEKAAVQPKAVRKKAAAKPEAKSQTQAGAESDQKKPGKAVAPTPAVPKAGVKAKAPAQPVAATSRQAMAQAPVTVPGADASAPAAAEAPTPSLETAAPV